MIETTRFAVFRAKDARSESEMQFMQYDGMTPVIAEGARKTMEAGPDGGHDLKLLFSMPGFSLSYAWFKSGFPLPRHSHNVDCLYYIIGGSLFMGHEELSAGDGFFVGKDVPYSYKPGPDGVEVLEFRAADTFNIRIMANHPEFWENAAQTVRNHQSQWARETRPRLRETGSRG